jgi:hypothetical protein
LPLLFYGFTLAKDGIHQFKGAATAIFQLARTGTNTSFWIRELDLSAPASGHPGVVTAFSREASPSAFTLLQHAENLLQLQISNGIPETLMFLGCVSNKSATSLKTLSIHFDFHVPEALDAMIGGINLLVCLKQLHVRSSTSWSEQTTPLILPTVTTLQWRIESWSGEHGDTAYLARCRFGQLADAYLCCLQIGRSVGPSHHVGQFLSHHPGLKVLAIVLDPSQWLELAPPPSLMVLVTMHSVLSPNMATLLTNRARILRITVDPRLPEDFEAFLQGLPPARADLRLVLQIGIAGTPHFQWSSVHRSPGPSAQEQACHGFARWLYGSRFHRELLSERGIFLVDEDMRLISEVGIIC